MCVLGGVQSWGAYISGVEYMCMEGRHLGRNRPDAW